MVRHEWYQTDTHVVVTIFARNLEQDERVKIEIDELSIHVQLPVDNNGITSDAAMPYEHTFPLSFPIIVQKSSFSVSTANIEIRLLKQIQSQNWKSLTPTVEDNNGALKYPSSARKKTDWDAVAKEVGENEVVDANSDQSIDAFFRKLYSGADEETKRAMTKSFVESQGTVLSTNWKEVGEKRVEPK